MRLIVNIVTTVLLATALTACGENGLFGNNDAAETPAQAEDSATITGDVSSETATTTAAVEETPEQIIARAEALGMYQVQQPAPACGIYNPHHGQYQELARAYYAIKCPNTGLDVDGDQRPPPPRLP